ncbi:hypothetical protein AAVH_14098 [Aphelenchoides avenae]|nr:hypothetical protein AAVH_14098 [Aphelenchus avenae]
MQSPRQELHPETVIKLLRATVKKIICSETTVPSQHRSKVGRTTQDWHKLRIAGRPVNNQDLRRSDHAYSQKEVEFISTHLTELVPSAMWAHRKADLVCYHALLNYICSVVYSWYISYDFDAIPWIRKMFCTAEQFSTSRRVSTDKYHETEISNSLILPSLTSEAHLFRQLFNYSMPVGSSQRNELAGSQLENWEDICHFENMQKMYEMLWSDKLLSKASFPDFRRFIKQCIEQDRQHGSKLLGRMVLRRAISALVHAESKERGVRIRNLMFLRRLLTEGKCDLVDVSGYDIADYATLFGNTEVLEFIRRISSDQGPQPDRCKRNFSREDNRLASELDGHSGYAYFQYIDGATGLLWDDVGPELQRPFEMSAMRLLIEPNEQSAAEFRDWRFEPRQILRVLRGDVGYLSKQRYMGSDTARLPTDVLSKTHAKPFHLVLDPGNSSKNCSDWQRDPRLIASLHSGRLVLCFMNKEHKETDEDLFLLDYTLSFGSSDRPGPVLRFLRIVNKVAPMSAGFHKSKSPGTEETPWIRSGPSGPAIAKMMVLSIDDRINFRPYLEVRGTAIPIYSPLKDLSMLLDGVFEMSKAFPSNPTLTEKLDHALDMMTANGWSEHVQEHVF